MFTGIVEATGVVEAIIATGDALPNGTKPGDAVPDGGARLTISCPGLLTDVRFGDSISVAGVCLTVSDFSAESFTVDVMPETLRHTRIGALKPGERVNLELALSATARLGGHIVQGHVDAVATLIARRSTDRWDELDFEADAELGRYIAHKGSIALDGVSLTISSCDGAGHFGVSLIPTTLAETTLGTLAVGGHVNVEVDVLAKYVERLGTQGALEAARSAVGHDAGPSHPTEDDTNDAEPIKLSTIDEAIEAFRAGRPVLVADDHLREDEVDVILPAQFATPEWIAWIVRNSSGYLCAPMPTARAEALGLPLMVPDSQDPRRTAYTVSVDAARGVTTGISATDRATTLRLLADPTSGPDDFIRPGHVLPLRAVAGGVALRAGHTEAAVDLCQLAGLEPVGVIAELVREDGAMMRVAEALELGRGTGLPIITISELSAAIERSGNVPPRDVAGPPHLEWRASHLNEALLPTLFGDFKAFTYLDSLTGHDHMVLIKEPSPSSAPDQFLVRMHSECLTGDALGSLRCDCGPQLHDAMRQIAEDPAGGALIYLRGHEGRGIGLAAKLAAYALQDQGMDTVDANLALGHPVDSRDYSAAAEILKSLSYMTIRLLTNNPEKAQSLASHGIEVAEIVAHHVGRTPHNAHYLDTKTARMGHHPGSDYSNDYIYQPITNPRSVTS